MNTIPTAKELFDKMISENDEATSTEMMIEFAKMHVEAALKTASQNASLNYDEWDDMAAYIDRDSIENAYPLTNIK